jgi:hypothetical protein
MPLGRDGTKAGNGEGSTFYDRTRGKWVAVATIDGRRTKRVAKTKGDNAKGKREAAKLLDLLLNPSAGTTSSCGSARRWGTSAWTRLRRSMSKHFWTCVGPLG